MGQKINPTGLRVGVIKDWESRWYAKNADFGDMLVEDYNLREWLLTKLARPAFPRSRLSATQTVCVSISTAQSPAW